MIETDSKLSELAEIIQRYPQALINVKVSAKPPIETVTALQEQIVKSDKSLGDEGRVLVRYSGTEQVCRVMVEGPTRKEVNSVAELLASVVDKELGFDSEKKKEKIASKTKKNDKQGAL
jgi:phosphoglucosamine mutase